MRFRLLQKNRIWHLTPSRAVAFFHIVVFNLLLHYRLPEASTRESLCVAVWVFSCFLYLFNAAAAVFEEHLIRKDCINTNHMEYQEDA